MKAQLGKLIIWILALYFLFELKDVGQMGFERVLKGWTNRTGLLLSLSSTLTFSFYTIGTYLILLRLVRWHWFFKTFLILLNIVLAMCLRYCIEEIFYLWAFGFDNFYDTTTTKSYFFSNIYYATVYSAFGGIFYLLQERQEQALQLENKKIELAFLRSQMNPHFLFNTLNNIYTLVYQKSEKALTAFDQLNGLLRYSLYEAEEKVPLSKELKYIDSFITLQELRYDFPIAMEMKIDIRAEACRIPPFLFITFVENGFKHGLLKDPKRPFRIELHKREKNLFFYCKNWKNHDLKDQQGGIGLENIKKRLSLIYQDQHQLIIDDQTNFFEVKLMIPLEC